MRARKYLSTNPVLSPKHSSTLRTETKKRGSFNSETFKREKQHINKTRTSRAESRLKMPEHSRSGSTSKFFCKTITADADPQNWSHGFWCNTAPTYAGGFLLQNHGGWTSFTGDLLILIIWKQFKNWNRSLQQVQETHSHFISTAFQDVGLQSLKDTLCIMKTYVYIHI